MLSHSKAAPGDLHPRWRGARSHHGRRALAAALAVALSVAGCRRATPPAPAAAAAPTPAPSAAAAPDLGRLAPEARAHYQQALSYVAAGSLDEAQDSLEQAVAIEPSFTEAWYNLGATYSNQAVRDAGRGDDSSALEFFRKGVAAKARARELMNEGTWFLYGERERWVVHLDVEEALRDADEVLADEEALLTALRLRAVGVRHPAE